MFDHVHELVHLIARWVHLIAGIMWIGNSMLFNWLDRNLEKPQKDQPLSVGTIWMVHSGGFYEVEKKSLAPSQMPKTLHWFKWQNGITWLSGVDYVIAGFTQLRGRGDFNRSDLVRLFASVAMPLTAFGALTESPAPAWPLITIISIELAVGGLDNLLSHHKKAAGAIAWGSRTLGVAALLGLAIAVPAQATALVLAAMAVSIIGVAREFWRGSDYYLDKRIRRRELAAS